jgi:hypothetical protein
MCLSHLRKVGMLDSFTYFNQTPILEWYVLLVQLQKRVPKNMHLKEIGMNAIILGSIINIIGGTCMTF